MSSKYIPGVCNIGPQERQFRKNAGLGGLVLSLLYLIIMIIFDLTLPLKLVIFAPVFLTTICFLQYKMHFCAEFGILGRYNFSSKVGNTLSIEEQEYLRLDRIKALKIILYSLLISIIITGVLVVFL